MNGKFRVYNKRYATWLDKNDFLLNGDGILCEHGSCKPVNNPENFIVQFFIGLQDKNEKDIYDGDIVSHYSSCKKNNYEVCFNASAFILKNSRESALLHHFYHEDEILVLGNILENPELLRKKQ